MYRSGHTGNNSKWLYKVDVAGINDLLHIKRLLAAPGSQMKREELRQT